MKKYIFLLLITQVCFGSQDMTFEKDTIVVCCKKSVKKTQFADLHMPMLYHLTITNNNKGPCFIDPSVLIKNKLIDESVLKRDIAKMLHKKSRTKCIAYGCGSLVFACISLLAWYNFYDFCNNNNTHDNQVFVGSQGSLNNFNFSRPNLSTFNPQAPQAAPSGYDNSRFGPPDLLEIKDKLLGEQASSISYSDPSPPVFSAEDSAIHELSNSDYYPSLGFFNLLLIANTLTSPAALCSLTLFLAKKYFDKAEKIPHAYLNYAILSQREPIVIAPGSSVEKIFALEDISEPIIINGDGIQMQKNFWNDMTKFFSKKK